MIERGFRHSWLHGSDRPSARVPAVRSQDQETPRGSVERRHGRIVKKDVEDQCGFQTIDVFVGQWMPDATAIERKLHDQEYRTCGGCARVGGTAPCFCGATAAASARRWTSRRSAVARERQRE
jgi:hypothetical protein